MGRRSFSREFKFEAVKLVLDRGVAIRQAASDLGLHPNVLRKWVKDAKGNAGHAFPGRGKQRPDDAAKADVFDYVERFYNPRRRHSTLGYLSPVEYEKSAGSA